MSLAGPFRKDREAAAFCGQTRAEWENITKMFDIPRCGPGLNVYAESVLNDFMARPEKYLKRKAAKPRSTTSSMYSGSFSDFSKALGKGELPSASAR